MWTSLLPYVSCLSLMTGIVWLLWHPKRPPFTSAGSAHDLAVQREIGDRHPLGWGAFVGAYLVTCAVHLLMTSEIGNGRLVLAVGLLYWLMLMPLLLVREGRGGAWLVGLTPVPPLLLLSVVLAGSLLMR